MISSGTLRNGNGRQTIPCIDSRILWCSKAVVSIYRSEGPRDLARRNKRVAVLEAQSLIESYVPAEVRQLARDVADDLRLQLDKYGRYIDALNRMRRYTEIVTDSGRIRNLTEAIRAATYLHLDPDRATAVGERMEQSFGTMASELQDLRHGRGIQGVASPSLMSIWRGGEN